MQQRPRLCGGVGASETVAMALCAGVPLMPRVLTPAAPFLALHPAVESSNRRSGPGEQLCRSAAGWGAGCPRWARPASIPTPQGPPRPVLTPGAGCCAEQGRLSWSLLVCTSPSHRLLAGGAALGAAAWRAPELWVCMGPMPGPHAAAPLPRRRPRRRPPPICTAAFATQAPTTCARPRRYATVAAQQPQGWSRQRQVAAWTASPGPAR